MYDKLKKRKRKGKDRVATDKEVIKIMAKANAELQRETVQQEVEIEQLKKENEWLIEAWADDIFIDDEFTPMKKLKSEILKKMQQALKDGK